MVHDASRRLMREDANDSSGRLGASSTASDPVARRIALLACLLTVGCGPAPPEARSPVEEARAAKGERAAAPSVHAATESVVRRAPARVREKAVPSAVELAAPTLLSVRPVAPTVDLKTLKTRLEKTKAIGLLTKLALKNQVDDLMDGFREYYEGRSSLSMGVLRRSYELLMMKVLSLLQDEDATLASAVVASRETIWAMLSDAKQFAALDA